MISLFSMIAKIYQKILRERFIVVRQKKLKSSMLVMVPLLLKVSWE